MVKVMFTVTMLTAIAEDEADAPPDPVTRFTTVAVVLD